MSERPKSSAASGDVKSLFGWLDRVIETKLSLLFVSVVVAADIGLGWSYNSNLLDFDWSRIQGKLGVPAIFIASYLLFMAWLSPALQAIVDELVFAIRQGLASLEETLFKPARLPVQPPSPTRGSVFALRDKALDEKSEFELDLANEHIATEELRRRRARTLAHVSFACLTLVCVQAIGSNSSLEILSPVYADAISAVLAIVIGLPWAAYTWIDSPFRTQIHYPPLAKELLAQWRKKRDL